MAHYHPTHTDFAGQEQKLFLHQHSSEATNIKHLNRVKKKGDARFIVVLFHPRVYNLLCHSVSTQGTLSINPAKIMMGMM